MKILSLLFISLFAINATSCSFSKNQRLTGSDQPSHPPGTYIITAEVIVSQSQEAMERPRLLSDAGFQYFMRSMSKKKGVDLLTLSSVCTKANQRVKMERLRETPVPGLDRSAKFTSGLQMDFRVRPEEGGVRLQGVATVSTLTALKAPTKSDLAGTTEQAARIDALLPRDHWLLTPVGDAWSHTFVVLFVKEAKK